MAVLTPEETSRRRKGLAMLALSGLTLLGSLVLVVMQFGWVSLSWPDWPDWSFGWGEPRPSGYERLNVNRPTPVPVPGDLGLTAAEMSELRRVQREHLDLIASIPPTATPLPAGYVDETTAVEKKLAAEARVREFPAGMPVTPDPVDNWFDSRRGLYFYQSNGGDWTTKAARELNPYSGLFYYAYYPDSVSNFEDGSIYRDLAREMAFQTVELLPPLVEVTPRLIDLMAQRMGWQLREGAAPVVNVWTTFGFHEEGRQREYAVGGVMRMAVRSWEDNGETWEYVAPGDWVGTLVLERVR